MLDPAVDILPTVGMTYPHLRINALSDVIPILVSNLSEGVLPIYVMRDGTLLEIGTFDESPLNLKALIDIVKPEYHSSGEERVQLKEVKEYMEVLARGLVIHTSS